MTTPIADPLLLPIWEKIKASERLSFQEGVVLYQSSDLEGLRMMANHVREQKNGKVATYIFNRYLNYSNLCVLSCQFCAYGAKKRDEHAFEHTIEELVVAAREAQESGAIEIHMVGGLHPTLPGQWYLDLLQAMSQAAPKLYLKAFTAVEVKHLAKRIFKKSLQETLTLLREAGLDALTGGGAEIFDPTVRDQICRGKETAEEWLEIHRLWHQMGMRSTATMLFGHIETAAQRVDHLMRLRELQDETAGFTALVPYAFVPETTEMAHIKPASEEECLKNIAVSRLMLDNFEHITAYWISFGLPLAARALSYGADDLHGTISEEKIFHMAGATTPQEQSILSLEAAIRGVGLQPKQRDTFYQTISNSHKNSR
ncbi:MAG: aminofutalosine synthase MqnE [Chthoniobacterales bacterium]|nr:aminofutalosine synthase MqnE [Chthoniobacterales bacterium]